MRPTKSLDPNLVDGIPGHFYGGKRDVIEVEIVSIDGQPYTTNIRSSDAIRDIYMGSLKMDKNEIIGVQVSWKGRPNIMFRLKHKISIDNLPQRFTYDKEKVLEDGSKITNTISCMIKGVRPPRTVDDGTRWVTFEKCGWKLTHPQIEQWASYYGTVLSKIQEATDDDLDPDVRPDDNTVGCGNLQVKVKIIKPIPQFLPMHGYKVRVYYKDIPKMCTNCYKTGHLRKDCKNDNKNWLHYVVDFITDNDQIDEEDFGFWMKKSRDYIRANPEMFNCPEIEMEDLNLSSASDIGNLNIDSDASDHETDSANTTVTEKENESVDPQPIKVTEMVQTIETKSKPTNKSQPTGEAKKSRGPKTSKNSPKK